MTPNQAQPEKFPNHFRKTKCALCDTCWMTIDLNVNPRQRCFYGGPFIAYIKVPAIDGRARIVPR